MLANNAPPTEAAASGKSVAAAGAVKSPTGPTLGKKKGRHDKKKKVEPKKQSAQMQRFEHSVGNSKKDSSVVDTPAEHTKSFVPPTTTSNTGNSSTGHAQRESTDQAEVTASQSTFRATAISTKPARVASVGQQDLLNTSKTPLEALRNPLDAHKNPLGASETRINAPEDTCQARKNPWSAPKSPFVKNPLEAPKNPLNAHKNPLEAPNTPLEASKNTLEASKNLEASSTTGPSHKHTTSVALPSPNQPTTPPSPSPSPSLPSTIPTPQSLIANLNLPGITYDPFGICISPTAPPWVRGRIARRVQILVSELEQGIQGGTFDPALELEMEKKEKAFFGEAIWNRLFEVEVREGREGEELREEYAGWMRGFDGVMEGERECREGMMDEDGEGEMMEMQRSLPQEAQAVDGHPVESMSMSMPMPTPNQDFVSGNPPLNLDLPPRPPPPPQMQMQMQMQMRYPSSRFNKHYGSKHRDAYPTRTMNSPPPPSFSRHRTPRAPKICPYYPRNKCFFGAECRYLHVLPHELELDTEEEVHASPQRA